MAERWPASRALPRLAAEGARAGTACNVAGLVCTALVGAGLVHLLAYHVPLGVPFDPRWDAEALDLLERCPLLGPLGLVFAIAVLAPLLALGEILRLRRLSASLSRLVRASHVVSVPGCDAVPRSTLRLAGFAATLFVLQVLLVEGSHAVCPMQITMVMGGTPMTMSLTPDIPLGPLHLVVALLCALLLWCLEHRLWRLRTAIEQCLHLLRGASVAACVVRRPDEAGVSWWYGHALFARPPPT